MANLLFSSGFESGVSLIDTNTAVPKLTGADSTGYNWWGGMPGWQPASPNFFNLITADTYDTMHANGVIDIGFYASHVPPYPLTGAPTVTPHSGSRMLRLWKGSLPAGASTGRIQYGVNQNATWNWHKAYVEYWTWIPSYIPRLLAGWTSGNGPQPAIPGWPYPTYNAKAMDWWCFWEARDVYTSTVDAERHCKLYMSGVNNVATWRLQNHNIYYNGPAVNVATQCDRWIKIGISWDYGGTNLLKLFVDNVELISQYVNWTKNMSINSDVLGWKCYGLKYMGWYIDDVKVYDDIPDTPSESVSISALYNYYNLQNQ